MSAGFALTGMPFCGMPWVSVLLTTDKSVCYPEPLRDLHEPDDIGRLMDVKGYDFVGVADASLAFFPEILESLLVPKVVIMTDPAYSTAQLIKSGADQAAAARFIQITMAALEAVKAMPFTLTVMAHQIRRRQIAQQIFWHCLPDLSFDQVRYDLLSNLVIEQSLDSVIRSTKVLSGMQQMFRERYEGVGATLQ